MAIYEAQIPNEEPKRDESFPSLFQVAQLVAGSAFNFQGVLTSLRPGIRKLGIELLGPELPPSKLADGPPTRLDWTIGRIWWEDANRLLSEYLNDPHRFNGPTPAIAEPPSATTTVAPESAEERQDRRLLRLRALGADMEWRDVNWKTCGKRGALAALVREEHSAMRPYRDDKSVRTDLQAAAKRDAEAKREGASPASWCPM